MTDPKRREQVRQRAGERCEYCLIPQSAVRHSFHIEHIIARQHQGGDEISNLALACDRCNFYKGTNLTAIDPVTGNIVLLFHPRIDLWSNHFEYHRAMIFGTTPTGRATARLLRMNAISRVKLRRRLGFP